MDYAIEVRDFTKRFGYKTAVDKASFQVKKGDIHGLVGENGAGKSTIFNALVGLVIASGGELFIEGKKVIVDPSFNSNIGYVPAEPLFPRNMRVKKFIEFCGLLRDIPASQVARKLNTSSLNRLSEQKCISVSPLDKKNYSNYLRLIYISQKF